MTKQSIGGAISQNLKTSWLLFALLLVGGILAGCSDNPTQPADTGAVVDGSNLPAVDKALTTTVHCQGIACKHFGDLVIPGYPNRDYSYIVTPSAAGIDRFDVAVHDANHLPENVILPAGWTWQLVPLDYNQDAHFVAHGKHVRPESMCSLVLRFKGPKMTTQFQIGYKYPGSVHTVNWDTSDGSVANWGQPVGVDLGPIHSPLRYINDGGYTGPGDVVHQF